MPAASQTPTPSGNWTSTPTGTPVVVDGAKGYVQQGPAWLVEWVSTHPGAVNGIFMALVAVTVVGAAAGYYRGGGLDQEVIRAMSRNGVLALSIMTTTHLVTTNLQLPYLADIAVGVALGWVFQYGVFRAIDAKFSDPEGVEA